MTRVRSLLIKDPLYRIILKPRHHKPIDHPQRRPIAATLRARIDRLFGLQQQPNHSMNCLFVKDRRFHCKDCRTSNQIWILGRMRKGSLINLGVRTGFLVDLVDEEVEGLVLGVGKAREEREDLVKGLCLEGEASDLELALDFLL